MNLSELYRIPWTKHDNPNGWIEVTTACQLDCPGCYRAEDAGVETSPEEQLVRLQADVDTLIEKRNIQALSIAGGEPLLYPRLDELVAYARARGIASRLYTNGILLTPKRLDKLQRAGMAEAMVHASLWQNRLKPNTLEKLLELKSRFIDMFRANGKARLGFIEPAMRSNWPRQSEVFAFYQRNSDVVNNVAFTIFKDEYGGPGGEQIPLEEVSDKIVECYGSQPCAFIPKLYHQDRAAWLLNVALIREGRVLGGLDGTTYGLMQDQYREVMGKYLFTPEPETTRSGMAALAKIALGEAVSDSAEELEGTVNCQVVSIVDSPQLLEDGRVDMCDSCPDAILYNGDLVPKCILDKIKAGLEVAVVR